MAAGHAEEAVMRSSLGGHAPSTVILPAHGACCGKREAGGECITNENPFVRSSKAPWWTVDVESVAVAKFAHRDDADAFAQICVAAGRCGVYVR